MIKKYGNSDVIEISALFDPDHKILTKNASYMGSKVVTFDGLKVTYQIGDSL